MAWHEVALAPDVAEIPRLLEWIEQTLAAEGLAGAVAFKVTLALEEAVMNVINHAFVDMPPPHLIQVRLELGATALGAEVVDNGRPFDPSAAAEPDLSLPLETRDPGGLGIHLIRTMMDRVEYRRSDGHNRLLLEKALG